ncbi:hypothetical protein G9A89_022076 [Geosiphon pyriformis]|nr:hypothetical protein G9A89_022076 [Geosiphon pyriformis]
MSMKKWARSATASSVSRSLRQKPKVLLDKIKHSDDKADLTYKLPANTSSQYENIDTSYNEKLECKIDKNMGYSAGNESDRQLDSCTNTPKAKRFNSGTVNAPSLGLYDFGLAINDFDIGLPSPVSLRLFYHPVASVKEKLCFEPAKSFALNIGLLAVLRSTLCNKLKGVRSLFYKIDSFGGALTPSKFPGIIQASFISDSSFAMAKQLAVSKNLVINADLKKIGIHSDQEIVIKEIPVNLPKSVIESALVKYEKIFSIKIQLIGLWQKALVEFKSFQVADLVVSKWSILLGKDSVCVAKANTNKQMWDLRNSYHALLYTLLIDTTAHNFSDLVQSYGGKTYKRHLVLIYAKKQTPVFCLVFFSGATWAFVISGSSKNSYSILLIENNSSIGSVNSLMSVVKILASRVSVFERLFKNVLDQVANISSKLDRLLAVLSANFAVLFSSKYNPVLNMAVNALLFVPPEIFPSGAHVLTAKVSGLETNLVVLENSIKVILNKLDSFGSGSAWKIATCNVRDMNVPAKQDDIIKWHMVLNNDISIVTETKLCSSIKSWIANKFPGVKVFISGLDAGFLGVGIALIMNEKLAKHVSKISEILGRLLMIHLLFKNKQSVFVLGLYVETSLNKHMIQAGFVNFFIARACNKSIFVILGSNFNKNGNKHSSSFSKCADFGLVNTLVNSSHIKAFTWKNSRSFERTIDYIFVSQSLSNVLVKVCVVDVDEFFNTDYSSVYITIGFGGILDPVLRAIRVQANKAKIASHDNFAMFSDEFTDSHSASDLDGILKLLVSKLVKASHSVSSIEFVFLLDVWMSLNSVNAFIIKFFFLLGSHFDAIRSALAKIRKFYCSLKMMESKCARNSQIRLAIDKRMEKFELNKGQTIRNPGLVKDYVDRIMEGWTRKHVVADNISDD